jgi:hypothetical protein
MTYLLRLAFAFTIAVVIGLTGCGKKPSQTGYSESDFDNPSPQLLQEIANKQGWKLTNVIILDRVEHEIDAHQHVSDGDWNALVKAVDEESIGFGNTFLLTICTTYPLEERFRPTVLKWCEKNMSQEESAGHAVIAYFCYALAKGPDKDAWNARLVARGGVYPEKMANEEETITKWQIKLARLEREAQNGTN